MSSTQHKAMVQKTRKHDREEMLKTIFEQRRSKGIWFFGFLASPPFNQFDGYQGILPVLRISKVRSSSL